MEVTITATEANRKFSQMLHGVRKGTTYVITSHGERIAALAPCRDDADAEEARRRKVWQEMKKRLESQPALNLPHITRDEMYE